MSEVFAEEMFSFEIKDGEKNYKYLNPKLTELLSEDNVRGENQLVNIFSSEKTRIGKHSICWKKPGYESQNPTVYVTSAGMCSAGPVLNHLDRCLPNDNNTIILTGYQGSGTVGNKLMRIMNGEILNENPLDEGLPLKPSEVRAMILMMNDYSGHADKASLLDYLFNIGKGFNPPEIHLNHGDDTAREALKFAIKERHKELELEYPGTYKRPNVCIPEINSTYVMTDGEIEPVKHDESAPDNIGKILSILESFEKRLTALET